MTLGGTGVTLGGTEGHWGGWDRSQGSTGRHWGHWERTGRKLSGMWRIWERDQDGDAGRPVPTHHYWSHPHVVPPVPRLAGLVTTREAKVTAATRTMVTLSSRLRRAGQRLHVLRGTGALGEGHGDRDGDMEVGRGHA